MSLPISEELLSAYLDGELSPSERELVDRLLDELPALREQLAELAQVGQKLRELPRNPAPPALKQNVMAAITARPSLVSSSEVASRPLRTKEITKAAGALVACLAVGISVWLANRPAEESAVGMPAETLAVREMADSRVEFRNAEAEIPQMTAAVELQGADRDSGAAESRNGVNSGTPRPVTSAAAAPAMAGAAMKVEQDEYAIRDRLLAPGYVPNAGELLSYLDVVDDQPVVVEYAVADVQRALGQVQVLLSRNGIRSVGEAGKSVQAGGDGMVAIYLEANDQELTQVLDGLNSLPLVMVVDESASTKEKVGQRLLQSRSFSQADAKQMKLKERQYPEAAANRPPAPPVAVPLDDQELQDKFRLYGDAPARPANAPVESLARPAADGTVVNAARMRQLRAESDSFQLSVPEAQELKSRLSSRKDIGKRSQTQQTAQGNAMEREAAERQMMRRGNAPVDQEERRRVVIFLQGQVAPAASPATEPTRQEKP